MIIEGDAQEFSGCWAVGLDLGLTVGCHDVSGVEIDKRGIAVEFFFGNGMRGEDHHLVAQDKDWVGILEFVD